MEVVSEKRVDTRENRANPIVRYIGTRAILIALAALSAVSCGGNGQEGPPSQTYWQCQNQGAARPTHNPAGLPSGYRYCSSGELQRSGYAPGDDPNVPGGTGDWHNVLPVVTQQPAATPSP